VPLLFRVSRNLYTVFISGYLSKKAEHLNFMNFRHLWLYGIALQRKIQVGECGKAGSTHVAGIVVFGVGIGIAIAIEVPNRYR
jgi:hypothetical protein